MRRSRSVSSFSCCSSTFSVSEIYVLRRMLTKVLSSCLEVERWAEKLLVCCLMALLGVLAPIRTRRFTSVLARSRNWASVCSDTWDERSRSWMAWSSPFALRSGKVRFSCDTDPSTRLWHLLMCLFSSASIISWRDVDMLDMR